MSKPRIIPFKPEHLMQINTRFATGSFTDYLAVGRMYEAGGPAFSAELAGQLLGAAGVVILQKPFERVGEAWVWVPQEVVAYPLFFHRNVKAMMAEVKQMKRLVRIQTTVQVLDAKANRWIKRLGFEAEGVMRRAGVGGTDVIRYSIVDRREAQEASQVIHGQDTTPAAINSV